MLQINGRVLITYKLQRLLPVASQNVAYLPIEIPQITELVMAPYGNAHTIYISLLV